MPFKAFSCTVKILGAKLPRICFHVTPQLPYRVLIFDAPDAPVGLSTPQPLSISTVTGRCLHVLPRVPRFSLISHNASSDQTPSLARILRFWPHVMYTIRPHRFNDDIHEDSGVV